MPAGAAAHAFDTTTAFTAKSLYVTSKLTSTPFENKLLRDARGDAASFVASDGSIRGARLEAALRWLRVAHPELAASDQELAEAILPNRRSPPFRRTSMRRSSMRHSPLFAALLLALCATAAEARSVVATSNIIVRALDRSIDFTSDTTTSVRDMKVVTEARDDAASFVASDGAIRGAQLEAAMRTLRSRLPEAREASDQVLAEAILAL